MIRKDHFEEMTELRSEGWKGDNLGTSKSRHVAGRKQKKTKTNKKPFRQERISGALHTERKPVFIEGSE